MKRFADRSVASARPRSPSSPWYLSVSVTTPAAETLRTAACKNDDRGSARRHEWLPSVVIRGAATERRRTWTRPSKHKNAFFGITLPRPALQQSAFRFHELSVRRRERW